MRTQPHSQPPAGIAFDGPIAQISTYVEMPMPNNRPFARAVSALGKEPVPRGELFRSAQRRIVVAAVVGEPARRRERKFRRLRELFSPDLHAIDTELPRDDVHQALDQIRRLRPARASVRIRRHLVRINGGDVERHRRNAVAPCKHEARERRDRRCQQLVVRAEIGDRVRLQSENRAVVLHGHLRTCRSGRGRESWTPRSRAATRSI